jgi:hypothetical protein
MTRIDGRALPFMGQGSNMELTNQTRFEQVPLPVVLKIVEEQAKLHKVKIAEAILKQRGGAK